MSAAESATSQRDEPESSYIAAVALGGVQTTATAAATNEEPATESGRRQLVYAIHAGNDGTGSGTNAEEAAGYNAGAASNNAEEPPRILVAPLQPARAAEFQRLKQWEGTVTEIRSDEFVALLRDLQDPDDPTRLEAVFGLEEIADGDAHLVTDGAVFVWTIGREKSPWGQIRNLDYIRFLRLPAWTRREVEDAEQRAEDLRALFDSAES